MQRQTISGNVLTAGEVRGLLAGDRIWIRKNSQRVWYSAEVLRGVTPRDSYPLARFDDPNLGWSRTTGSIAEQFGAGSGFWNLNGDATIARMTDQEREDHMATTGAPVEPASLPRISSETSVGLPPGTRVLAYRNGAWHPAEIIPPYPGSAGVRALLQFDEPGLGLGWNGRGRHPSLEDSDIYYWHDIYTEVVLDPATPAKGEDVTRIELPERPQWVEHYEVPTRPRRVENRWVLTKINGHLFHILYMGDCLACGYGTYTTPDGSVPASVGNRTLVVITDEGKRIRFCYACARSETMLKQGLANAKEATTETGPIEWPEEKMDLRLRHPDDAVKVGGGDDDDEPDPF